MRRYLEMINHLLQKIRWQFLNIQVEEIGLYIIKLQNINFQGIMNSF